MAMSGIRIEDATIKIYDDMRFKKEPGGIIFKIDDELILVEREIAGSIDIALPDLPDKEPRYMLFDIPLKNRAGIDVVKTVFVFWMPMASPVRLRMQYASSKQTITKQLRGIALQVQEEEKEAVTLVAITAKLNKRQGINVF